MTSACLNGRGGRCRRTGCAVAHRRAPYGRGFSLPRAPMMRGSSCPCSGRQSRNRRHGNEIRPQVQVGTSSNNRRVAVGRPRRGARLTAAAGRGPARDHTPIAGLIVITRCRASPQQDRENHLQRVDNVLQHVTHLLSPEGACLRQQRSVTTTRRASITTIRSGCRSTALRAAPTTGGPAATPGANRCPGQHPPRLAASGP